MVHKQSTTDTAELFDIHMEFELKDFNPEMKSNSGFAEKV